MSENNLEKEWSKVKHNPLCKLKCNKDLKPSPALETNNNYKNKYRLSGNCEYVCSKVPELIYNLDNTNFFKIKWYSNILLIVSLIIILVGLILKFVSKFNISSKVSVLLGSSSKFLIIPIGILLLFIGFFLPKNIIDKPNKSVIKIIFE